MLCPDEQSSHDPDWRHYNGHAPAISYTLEAALKPTNFIPLLGRWLRRTSRH